jgi:hypothetical protein
VAVRSITTSYFDLSSPAREEHTHKKIFLFRVNLTTLVCFLVLKGKIGLKQPAKRPRTEKDEDFETEDTVKKKSQKERKVRVESDEEVDKARTNSTKRFPRCYSRTAEGTTGDCRGGNYYCQSPGSDGGGNKRSVESRSTSVSKR